MGCTTSENTYLCSLVLHANIQVIDSICLVCLQAYLINLSTKLERRLLMSLRLLVFIHVHIDVLFESLHLLLVLHGEHHGFWPQIGQLVLVFDAFNLNAAEWHSINGAHLCLMRHHDIHTLRLGLSQHMWLSKVRRV